MKSSLVLLQCFLLLWCFLPNSYASVPWHKLRTGDVLLLSLDCWVCKLIEAEEGLPFSHLALVYRDQTGIKLVESWTRGVEIKTVEDFLKDKKINNQQKIVVLRHPSFFRSRFLQRDFLETLKTFLGKKYDPHFLWNNKDEEQKPLYYCSEFVFHFLKSILKNNLLLKTKKMTFDKNVQHWQKYFFNLRQKIPAGQEGISPADFVKSQEFKIIN